MRALVLAVALPAFGVISCSSEETPSASSSDNDSTDSDDTDDDDDDDAATLCDAKSSYDGDFVSSSQAVYYDSSTGIYTYLGELSSSGESAFVYIELYPDAGAFADDEPHTGTFTIEDDDADYATCGICVFVLVGDGSGTSFDDYVVHMATEGELTITRLPTTSGGTFTASLEDVTLEHIDIDADAGEATIADDGCDTTIADATLSATLDDEDDGDDSNVCEANSSYSGDFESGGQSTTYDSINDAYAYYGQLVDTTASGYTATFVMIQLYGGYGVFAGGDVTTGTFDISGDETDFSTCGVCVFVVPYDDADTTSTTDDINAYYLATSGTVVISTLTSSTLAGTLTDMTFEHVDIDSSGTSTPDADACTTSIADASFSSTITE